MTDNAPQPQDQRLDQQQQQQQAHPAYCEEFSEEAQTTVPETRQSANIAAKRSKPSDHPKSKKTLRDEFSDSGYSSHTHATLNSSLDSKLENARPSPSDNTALVAFCAHPNVVKSRAQGLEKDATAGAPKGTSSRSRRDGGSNGRVRDCGCEKCIAAAHGTHLGTHLLLDPYRSSTRPPAHPPSRHRTPAPPSPHSRRAPQIDMPREHTRPRPSPSSRDRPVSYHGGVTPDPMGMTAQPSYMVERAPAARQTAYPFLQPAYPTQPSFYQAPPPPPPQPPPPLAPQDYFQTMQPQLYEMQPQMQLQPRPSPRQWTSDRSLQRPQSTFYGAPPQPIYDYEYGDDPVYTGMLEPDYQPQMVDRSLPRRDRRSSLREAYSPRPSVSSPEDARRMPPPPPPPPKPRPEQRPQIRHAATATAAVHTHPRRRSHDESRHPIASTSRKPSIDISPPSRSRRQSVARPSLRTSEERNVSFDGIERGVHGMTLEPSATNTTSASSSKAGRRRSSVYSGHDESALRDLEGQAEAYQNTQRMRSNTSTSNSNTPISPLATNEDILSRLPLDTRKRTNTDSSESGSRASQRSGGSGSGLRARRPSNNDVRSAASGGENRGGGDGNTTGNFAMRFNPEGVNVKMQGGIDGRAINLRKSKDGEKGDVELSIGGKDENKNDRRKAITATAQQQQQQQHTERTGPAFSGAPAVRQIEHSSAHHHHQQEKRGRETPGTVGSRPSLAGREKSRRRYSYMDGGSGVREVHHEEGAYTITRIGSRDPYQKVADRSDARIGSRDDSGGRTGGYPMAGIGSRELTRDDEYRTAGGPRIIGERIVTTMRSRRSSRYGYD